MQRAVTTERLAPRYITVTVDALVLLAVCGFALADKHAVDVIRLILDKLDPSAGKEALQSLHCIGASLTKLSPANRVAVNSRGHLDLTVRKTKAMLRHL